MFSENPQGLHLLQGEKVANLVEVNQRGNPHDLPSLKKRGTGASKDTL